jgi:hypothetical protein
MADVYSEPNYKPEETEGRMLLSGIYCSNEYAGNWKGPRYWYMPRASHEYEVEINGRKYTHNLQNEVCKRFIYARDGYKARQKYATKPEAYPGWVVTWTGGNVSTAALGLALEMQYKKIIFVGHDFCHKENAPDFGDLWGDERCPYTPKKMSWLQRVKHKRSWKLERCLEKKPGEKCMSIQRAKNNVPVLLPVDMKDGCPICGGIPTDRGHWRKTNWDYHLYKIWTEDIVSRMLKRGLKFWRTEDEGVLFVHPVDSKDGIRKAGHRWPSIGFKTLPQLIEEGVIS